MSVNWAVIQAGATFQALVNVLLQYEHPEVRPFNKSGADGGIDALVVGNTVYQAKYHKRAKASQAFSDAKEELERVREHKKAGSKWAASWEGVDRWILVTNAPIGPEDEQRWQREIVPDFERVGLHASYWNEAQLEKLLTQYPGVRATYFGGRTRAFISLSEHLDSLRSREVLPRAYDVPVHGRYDELDRIRSFVKAPEERVLLIHGPGGVGKSRLLYESAKLLWSEGLIHDVHCATPNLAHGTDWYAEIIAENPAMVLLDDPDDAGVIERMLAELRHRTKRWKVLVATRTSNQPLITKLTNPRESVLADPLELRSLDEDSATRLASNLVETLDRPPEVRDQLVPWLVRTCGAPIWMTVAVRLLEEGTALSDLPKDSFAIATRYVQESREHTNPDIADHRQVLAVLRWIALYRRISREDKQLMRGIAIKTGLHSADRLNRVIDDLGRRRVVTLYGVNHRMCEIRPDVVRDHILLDWLTYERPDGERVPTSDAIELADKIADTGLHDDALPHLEHLLRMLGRSEYLIDPPVRLLDPIADAITTLAETAKDTLTLRRALQLMSAIAFFRPCHAVRLARTLRTSDVFEAREPSGLPSARVITLAALRSELSSLLFSAAHAATSSSERSDILRELMVLIALERQCSPHRGTFSTRATAGDTLARIIHSRRAFRSVFDLEAATLVEERLKAVASDDDDALHATSVLIRALIAIERQDEYPGPERYSRTLQRYRIRSDGRLGPLVASVRTHLWAIATAVNRTTTEGRFAWALLEVLHRELNRCQSDPGWRALLTDDFERCHAVVSGEAPQVEDAQGARALWDWHLHYEQDDEVRESAERCEEAYRSHPEVSPYVELFGGPPSADDAKALEWATKLAHTGSKDAIVVFFRRALRYTSTCSEAWRSSYVTDFARTLGRAHGGERSVHEFALETLAVGPASEQFPCALEIVRGWLHTLRSAARGGELAGVLEALFAAVSAETATRCLRSLYADCGPVVARALLPEELMIFERVVSAVDLDVATRFRLIGHFLALVPARALAAASAAFDTLAPSEQATAALELWEAYHACICVDEAQPSEEVIDRLLELTALVPDLGFLRRHSSWEAEQLLESTRRKPIRWLVDLIHRRLLTYADRSPEADLGSISKAVSILPPPDSLLLQVVEPVGAAGARDELSRAALHDLLAIDDGNAAIYSLPRFVSKLDPHGHIVPSLITERIAALPSSITVDAIWAWARYGSPYPMKTTAWRTIAIAACECLDSHRIPRDDHQDVFAALVDHSGTSSVRRQGDPDPGLQAALREAHAALEQETVPVLRPFWIWHARCVESSLEHDQARSEEWDHEPF
jgi:hypothetical protein